MRHLMNVADNNDDQVLDFQEFLSILADSKYRSWLSAMDIEVGEPTALFAMLDQGKGTLSLNELYRGTLRLRGQARSIDVVNLGYQLSQIEHELNVLVGSLNDQRH